MSDFQNLIPLVIPVGDELFLKRTTLDSAHDNIDMVWANMERFHRFPWANENYNLESFAKWIHDLELRPSVCEYDYRQNSKLIGRVSVRLEEDDCISFGYLLSREGEGHGYISQALQAAIALLKDLGYTEFGVIYNQNNTRSQAVALRNGFKEVGRVANPYNPDESNTWIKAKLFA